MEDNNKNQKSNKKKHSSEKIDRRVKKTLKAIDISAVQLFNAKNYNEITMEEIAEQADISRATLYTHFKSKEEIYFKIGAERFKVFNEGMTSLIQSSKKGFELVNNVCTILLERMITDPTASKIVYVLLTNDKLILAESILDEQISQQDMANHMNSSEIQSMIAFLKELRNFEVVFSAIVQKGIDDSTIITDLEPLQLTHYLIALLNGVIDQMVIRQHVHQRSNLKNEIVIERTLKIISQFLKNQ